MTRKKICIALATVLLTLFFYAAVQAQVTATVDRTQMSLNESLTMTIAKDGTSFFSKPDLTPLQKDFRVLNQGQSSSTRILNGSVSSSVSWNITLTPLHTGALEIPPISIGNETTEPIAITVSQEARTPEAADGETVFLETEVDEDTVFVQSQVILSLRVFIAIDAQLQASELQIEDAVIETLNASQYNKVINNRTYRVVEQKYAIYPQKSGTLEIPALVVRATLPQQQRLNDFFDPFGTLAPQGKTITLHSQSKEVLVKEKPPEYPTDAAWIPTAKLTVSEEWSGTPAELKVGESTTITIDLTAEGLPASQLPPLTLPEQEGIKLYQSKAEVENRASGSGITGIRRESIALIPTRPGIVRLPEIRLPWWNTKKNTVEYAVIAARELTISGGPEKTTTQTAEMPTEPAALPSPRTQAEPAPLPIRWIVLVVLLAAAWLTTLYFLVSTRRQLTRLSAGPENNRAGKPEEEEQESFRVLERACRRHDIRKTREAIIAWAQSFRPDATIKTFADIEHARIEPDLIPLLREIDALLYSADPSKDNWHGEKILEMVSGIRKKQSQRVKENEDLQPLYK